MIDVREAPRFQRSYKKLVKGRPSLEQVFFAKFSLFLENPFNPSLETHKLGGKLKNMWAFSLTHSLRVVFTFVEGNSVVLEDIGSHDDMY